MHGRGKGVKGRGVARAVQCSAAAPPKLLFWPDLLQRRVFRASSLSLTHTHTATDETKPVYCMRPRLGYLGWLSVFFLLLSSKF
jgi:hypothetical protein